MVLKSLLLYPKIMHIAVLLVKDYLISMGFNHDTTRGSITVLHSFHKPISSHFQVLNSGRDKTGVKKQR